MAFEIRVPRGRHCTFDVQITDADGGDVAIASTDLVRVKLGRRNNTTPDLDLNSTDNTGNVSFTAATNNVTVTLLQGDTSALTTGPYTCEVAIVDESNSDVIIQANQGVVHITETLGGSVGDV